MENPADSKYKELECGIKALDPKVCMLGQDIIHLVKIIQNPTGVLLKHRTRLLSEINYLRYIRNRSKR